MWGFRNNRAVFILPVTFSWKNLKQILLEWKKNMPSFGIEHLVIFDTDHFKARTIELSFYKSL